MARRLVLAAASLVAALLGGAADGGPPPPASDAGLDGTLATNVTDAALSADVEMPPDSAPVDPCGALEQAIARRMAWLEARRQEQFVRGPLAVKGVLNATLLFCEGHPDDPDCRLGGAVVEVGTSDLEWSPDASVDAYEVHVLGLRQELAKCRLRR